jgi:hypothetical protein
LHKNFATVTFNKIVPEIKKNVLYNLKYLSKGKSIKELKKSKGSFKNAIVVGAGPSLRRNNQIKVLKKYAKKFIIISCDGSLFYLLSNKIIPDLVVTLDPHETRIVRWFGDKKLTKKKIKKDDYFSRQDIEKKFNNELQSNKKIVKLFDKYSDKLKVATCTSSSKQVVNRLVKSKAKIFWWNPFLDDTNKKKSLTKKIYNMNKLPIINTGGNVGSAAWMMADSLFNCKKIGLIGMDFSYYLDTPLESTQYYDALEKVFEKKNVNYFFSKVYNSRMKKYFYSDHAYLWYKKCMLEMINNTKSETTNCTGGGILFGKSINWTPLNEFCKINS